MVEGGLQPIHFATMNGQLAIIQTLIDDYKVDPNSKSEHVLPPILLAQMGKKWDVVELLTDKYGCSINLALLSHKPAERMPDQVQVHSSQRKVSLSVTQ